MGSNVYSLQRADIWNKFGEKNVLFSYYDHGIAYGFPFLLLGKRKFIQKKYVYGGDYGK
jgi:hypothetical protein